MKKTKRSVNKKTNRKYSIIIGFFLLGTGLLIFLVYAIVPIFKPSVTMPCNIQVTVSALISFGIAFVWKLSGVEDK